MNKATGHNSYRMSWWHTVPRSMKPQGTLHIFLSMDRKSGFLLISCTQTQLIKFYSTSMTTYQTDMSNSKKRTIWFRSKTQKCPSWSHLSSQSKRSATKRCCSCCSNWQLALSFELLKRPVCPSKMPPWCDLLHSVTRNGKRTCCSFQPS